MGEATYYMKIKFKTSRLAIDALPKIREFLHQGAQAHDYWQLNRYKYYDKNHPKYNETTVDSNFQFWENLRNKFPIIYEYLSEMDLSDDYNNALAGLLDFGDEESINRSIFVRKKYVLYSARVWHFADWSYIGKYICAHFGALDFKFISDEYLNPFNEIIF